MEKVGKGDGIGVIEKPKKRVKKIKPPKKYAVILHMRVLKYINTLPRDFPVDKDAPCSCQLVAGIHIS